MEYLCQDVPLQSPFHVKKHPRTDERTHITMQRRYAAGEHDAGHRGNAEQCEAWEVSQRRRMVFLLGIGAQNEV